MIDADSEEESLLTAAMAKRIADQRIGGPEVDLHLRRILTHVRAEAEIGRKSISNVFRLDGEKLFELLPIRVVDLAIRLKQLGYDCKLSGFGEYANWKDINPTFYITWK